jgi:pimeloyl-ACP methyl ester carboxylesterase
VSTAASGSGQSPEPRPFTTQGAGGLTLSGEELGDPGAPAIVLVHGLTATRRYVVHGSRLLLRNGFRLISYDARGHGRSDPAPADDGYTYAELATDLEQVLADRVGERAGAVLAGHSMGAHTIARHALGAPERIAGVVLIGPAVLGLPPSDDTLAGVEGFVEAIDRDLDPAWRDVVLRITRDRIAMHRHPEAIVRALREVPRSLPFDGPPALERLDPPALVVASHDTADPGHPYAVAAAWAERIPGASLTSEEEGQSPLAWQGGRLSREIVRFCELPAVAERLGR